MRFLRLTATSIRKPSGDLCAPGDSGWQNAVGWFFDGDEGVRDEINVTSMYLASSTSLASLYLSNSGDDALSFPLPSQDEGIQRLKLNHALLSLFHPSQRPAPSLGRLRSGDGAVHDPSGLLVCPWMPPTYLSISTANIPTSLTPSAMHLNAMLHFFLLLIDEKGAERMATGTQHTSVVNAATDIERQSGRPCMRAV